MMITKLNRNGYRLLVIIIFNLQFLIYNSSCTQDAYNKGEGEYSLLRGDFVEAHTNGQKQVDYIITDDGEQLPMTKTYSAKWITTADSLYRCVLYYNKVKDEHGRETAEPVSMGQVPCPKIMPFSELDKDMKTDPVKFESAWMSKTGKYINLSFALKTGTTGDDKAIHTLRVVQDTILTNPDGTSTSYLRLYHDQGGVPDYYSTQVYASLITSEILADSACISINTYKGIVTKAFQIKKE
jgi:hypothetical protein